MHKHMNNMLTDISTTERNTGISNRDKIWHSAIQTMLSALENVMLDEESLFSLKSPTESSHTPSSSKRNSSANLHSGSFRFSRSNSGTSPDDILPKFHNDTTGFTLENLVASPFKRKREDSSSSLNSSNGATKLQKLSSEFDKVVRVSGKLEEEEYSGDDISVSSGSSEAFQPRPIVTPKQKSRHSHLRQQHASTHHHHPHHFSSNHNYVDPLANQLNGTFAFADSHCHGGITPSSSPTFTFSPVTQTPVYRNLTKQQWIQQQAQFKNISPEEFLKQLDCNQKQLEYHVSLLQNGCVPFDDYQEVRVLVERIIGALDWLRSAPSDDGQILVGQGIAGDYQYSTSLQQALEMLPEWKNLLGRDVERVIGYVQIVEDMKCIVSQPLSYFIPTLQQQSTAVTQSETLTRLQSFIEAKLKLYGDLLKTNGSRWRELGFPMMEDLFVNLRSHLLNTVGVFVETVVERLESVTTHLGRDMLDDGMVVDSGHGAGRIDENISKEMELTIASLRLLLSSLSLCGGIPTVAQMEHPHSIPTPISSSEPTIITPSTLVLCKLPIKLVNFFCVFLNYQLDRVTPTKEKVTSAGSISPRLLHWIQSLAKALGYLKEIKDALGSFSVPGLSSSNARNPHDHMPLSASSSTSSSSEYLDHHHRITPSSISTSSSITGLFFDSLEDQLSTSIVETTLRICSHINKPTFTHPSTYTSSSSFAGRNSVLTSSDVGGSTTGGVGSAKIFQSMMLCVVDIKLIKRCLDWWQNGFGAPSQYAALGSTHTGTGNAVIKHLWHQACSRLNRLEQLVEGYDDS